MSDEQSAYPPIQSHEVVGFVMRGVDQGLRMGRQEDCRQVMLS